MKIYESRSHTQNRLNFLTVREVGLGDVLRVFRVVYEHFRQRHDIFAVEGLGWSKHVEAEAKRN